MMEIFEGYVLLRPLWLLAVPILLIGGWFWRRRADSFGGWEAAVDAPLLAALEAMGRISHGGRARGWLPWLVAAGIALALSGPAERRTDSTAYRNLDGIVLALDLSPSMVASREFEAAITAARLVALGAGTRQTGLIVFAGDTYRASPMTTDARAIGDVLALLDAETMPDEGSRPALALDDAVAMLAGAEIRFGDVVLVTDGGGIDATTTARARAMREAGITLSVLHTKAMGGGGSTALASTGGGMAAPVATPEPVLDLLGGRRSARMAEAGYTVLLWHDYGRYLLVLALIPALLMFRRRGGRA